MQTENIYRFNLWGSFLTILNFISHLIYGIAESLVQVLTMKENEINHAFDIALKGEKSLKEDQSCIVLEKSAKGNNNKFNQIGASDQSANINDNAYSNQMTEEMPRAETLEAQSKVAESYSDSILKESENDFYPEFEDSEFNSSWAEIEEVESFVNSVKCSLLPESNNEMKIEDLVTDNSSVTSTEKAKKKRRRGKKKSSKSKEENESSTNESLTLSTSTTSASQKSPQKNQKQTKQQKNKQTPKKERDMSNWNAGKCDPIGKFDPNKKFSHSVLKLKESDDHQGIKPIRQPFGPSVDSNGFTSDYRKSRMIKH